MCETDTVTPFFIKLLNKWRGPGDQLYFMSEMTSFDTRSNVFGWIYDMVFDQKH